MRNVAFRVVGSLVHSIDKEFVLRGMDDGVGLVVDLLVRGRYVVGLLFSGGIGVGSRVVFLVEAG